MMGEKREIIKQVFIFLFLLILSACGSGSDDRYSTTPVTLFDEGTYSESDTIWLNWTEGSDPVYGITAYRLEVRDENDVIIFDEVLGKVLNYKVSGTQGQTLTARVAAINGAGQQGPWSDFSDGILLCGKYLSCLAGTIFVSTLGSDDNDGLSPDLPFLTIKKAVEEAGPGDVIDVAAGTYREQVKIMKFNGRGGNEKAPLVLRGNGEAIIDGSEPLSNWTSYGFQKKGTDNECRLWLTYFNPDFHPDLIFRDGIKRAPTQLFIDGTTRLDLLPRRARYYNGNAFSEEDTQTLANITSNLRPNIWAWINNSEIKNTVYVCLAAGELIENRIEMPVRNAAIVSDTGYLHISGFVTKRQASYGIIVKGDSTMKEVVIANNDISLLSGSRQYLDSDLGPHIKEWGIGLGISASVDSRATIMSNRVSDVSYTGIRVSRSPNGLSPSTYIRVSDNVIERITPHPYGSSRSHELGEALSGLNGSHHDLFENNIISDSKFGIWFDSHINSLDGGTSYATVTENIVSNTSRAIFFERATYRSIAKRNLIINADIGIKLGTSTQYGQEKDKSNPRFHAKESRIINNTIINAQTGIALEYASHSEVLNNIIYSDKADAIGTSINTGTIIINDAMGNSYGTVNNNLYHLIASSSLGCYTSACFLDFPSWYAQTGFDADSVHTDPLFSNYTDYSLTMGSPAIDSGINGGLADYCNGPDLGYVELLTGSCL